MSRTYASSFLLLLSFIPSFFQFAYASPCVAFDASFNLLGFGFGGKDYSVGTQDTWASATPADITATGRPPFDGTSPKCYLSQFSNAIYVLGADSANPASLYIYDAAAKSWSTQATTLGSLDISSLTAILDHDTNIFYGLSKGELWSLDMASLTKATSTPIAWIDQTAAGFNTDGYEPVMALAQNHIHFLNVPGNPAGSVDIFVIHFSFFQPQVQAMGNFPNQHGQTASFFKSEGVQIEFAYIPDDGSATYVVNVDTNTTQTLAGPTTKDSSATYFAGLTSLVQLSSSGQVSFLPYSADAASANTNAAWTTITAFNSLSGSAPNSSSTTTKSGGTSTTGAASAGAGTSKTSAGTSTGTSKTGTATGTSPTAAGSGNGATGITNGMIVGLIVSFITMVIASSL